VPVGNVGETETVLAAGSPLTAGNGPENGGVDERGYLSQQGEGKARGVER